MSNDYYTHSNTLIPGTTARAEDVTSELDAIEAGFDKIPAPRDDGQGFDQPIKAGQAIEDDHLATLGQLVALEQQAATSATNAEQSRVNAETAETNAETAQAAAEVARANAETAETNAETAETGSQAAQTASEAARDKAQEWADNAKDVDVEPGQYSAKHWAEVAQETVLGAKVFQGTWDASTGVYPSNPQTGHFWSISVAGTINTVAYQLGDELIYNGTGWDRVPNSSAVSSVNSQVGDVVLDAASVGASPSGHGHSNATTATSGYMSGADKTKLDGVESGATADQTDSEIKAAYENNANTNAFTDAEQTKLAGIESGATADQTGAEIKTAYEAEADTNAFSDAEQSKLAGIEANATADQTASEIKASYESNLNTNAYTDAEKSKLGAIEANATADQTGSEIKTAYEAQPDTNVFTDAEKTKLAGISSGATGDMTDSEIKTAYENNSNTNAFTDTEQSKLAGIEAGATADQTGTEIKSLYEAQGNTNAFTDADHSKLDGIESGATGDQTGAEIKALYESQSNTNAFTDALLSKLNGIESGATQDMTPAQILAALLGVDGPGSGLDADTLDGVHLSGLVQAVAVEASHSDAGGGLQLYIGNTPGEFDVENSVAAGGWASIGPSGSGANNTWTAMNALPASAKSVALDLLFGAIGTGAGAQFATVSTASEDVSSPDPLAFQNINVGGANLPLNEGITESTQIIIPLDSSKSFQIHWTSSFNATSIKLRYRGFRA